MMRTLVEAEVAKEQEKGGDKSARWADESDEDEEDSEDPWTAAARDQQDSDLPPEELGLTMEVM